MPQFPEHYTVVPDPDGKTWWCVDRVDTGQDACGVDLPRRRPQGGGARIMRNIAKGLKALHDAGVIYREMTTESIIVVDVEQGSVVLTDFELGKLLDGSPTVRGSGPGNPYRAKEVGGQDAHEARRATWTGTVGDASWCTSSRVGCRLRDQEGPCLEQADLPDRVKKIVARCLSPDPRARPRRADEVLKSIRSWR